MKMIGIIRNTKLSGTSDTALIAADYLKRHGVESALSADGRDLPKSCECAVVLGGDGTLLRAAKVVLERQLPLLGVNLGTLGFLAEIEAQNIMPALDHLIAGTYTVEKRMMLYGEVRRGSEVFYRDTSLNDVVVSRVKPLRACRFLAGVNGEHLNSYSSDGIIVSTATGSTGYNLSAGGPIVSPSAETILLTPVATHSLISRSIILSGTDRVTIGIGEGRTGAETGAASVWFDGTADVPVGTGDTVEIRKSERYTNIIKINNVSFLEALRRKMSDR